MNPKKPKVWCRHIKWIQNSFDPIYKYVIDDRHWDFHYGYCQVERSWKLCPICGKKRPGKGKRPKYHPFE